MPPLVISSPVRATPRGTFLRQICPIICQPKGIICQPKGICSIVHHSHSSDRPQKISLLKIDVCGRAFSQGWYLAASNLTSWRLLAGAHKIVSLHRSPAALISSPTPSVASSTGLSLAAVAGCNTTTYIAGPGPRRCCRH